MNLSLTEEQLLIKNSAEKYFRDNLPFDERSKIITSRGEDYKKIIHGSKELGWYALPFSEKYGGIGGSTTDVMTLIETFGASLHVDPFIFSVLFPGKVIENFCNDKDKNYYLNQIINGNLKIAYCFAEPSHRFNFLKIGCKVHLENNKYYLTGKKILVIGATEAELFLVAAKDKNNNVYLLKIVNNNKNFLCQNYSVIDDSLASDIVFDNFEFQDDDILVKIKYEEFIKKIEIIYDYLTLATCSEALGVIEKMYQLTLDYVKTREQFGKKIGDFQVIQHRMVDIYIKKEEMRSLNYSAQVSFYDNYNSENIAKNICLNKIFLDTKAKEISQDCIQLHGGMGVANEMSIGHYFKKITFLSMLFGDSDYHYRRYEKVDKK